MEKLFMSASVVITILLCFVGIVKLPFKKLKEKHPNLYKAIFTLVTLVGAVGLCVLNEIYILCGELLSLEFAVLLCAVFAGLFGGYNGIYEGLGLKELVKKIVENLKKAKVLSANKKAIKYLDKIDDIDSAIAYLEDKKFNKGNEV
jgi:hypothetical protein